ncbi:MAG: hydroxyacid dehydrogenase [Spirochaetales bacterium]|jgi:D-3-phosphoglycerate dehydrogenase|nr:hydroxyacid dehydrogenase [Spirochaetales bacterium]
MKRFFLKEIQMGYTVLIPQDIVEDGKKYLTDRGYSIKMGSGVTVERIIEDVKDCDAILARTAPFPKEVIEAGGKLRVIGRHGVGCDNIDVKTATERGIYVTYAPESNANSVAEYTVGMIIALARHFPAGDRAVRSGNWELRNKLPAMDLAGKTLGLVGAGRVGSMVAKKAFFGLDMKVVVFDPYIREIKGVPEAKIVSDAETIFRDADFVSLHVPSTPETKGMVGGKYFNMMKDCAFLINASRGEIVNEGDLYEALKSKRIAGAALDVFDPEPPKADNPLYALENVILSPHNAALTREAMARMAVHAAMGIDDVLSGRVPKWPFNKPAGK